MSNGATLGYSASILLISLKFCLDIRLVQSFMPEQYLLLQNVTNDSFGLRSVLIGQFLLEQLEYQVFSTRSDTTTLILYQVKQFLLLIFFFFFVDIIALEFSLNFYFSDFFSPIYF